MFTTVLSTARRHHGVPPRRAAALVWLVSTLAGCHLDIAPTQAAAGREPPNRAMAMAVELTPLTATVLVRTDAPAAVQVDYWADSTDRLRVLAESDSLLRTVRLSRLRAGRRYHFELRTVAADGTLGPASEWLLDTPPLPEELAGIRFLSQGTQTYGVTMFEVMGAFQGFVAVDPQGEPVWYQRTRGTPHGFTRRANGNFVIIDFPYGLVEVTPDGTVVRSADPDQLGGAPHHDVVATPANTLLYITQEERVVDGGRIVGDRVVEWDPATGVVTPRWSVFDHYDPSQDWGVRSDSADWTHMNSLALGPHGNIVISLNWLDQVVSVSPDWSTIEWRLGGRGSSYTFDEGAQFLGQHTAQLLSENRILMFDNGRDRAGGDISSRGLELALDPVTHRARVVWQFHASPEIAAPFVGSARRLPNGNTVVQFGISAGIATGATGPVKSFEVAPDGRVVASTEVQHVLFSYRGEPILSLGGEKVVPKP